MAAHLTLLFESFPNHCFGVFLHSLRLYCHASTNYLLLYQHFPNRLIRACEEAIRYPDIQMSRQRYSKGSIPIRPPSEMMCSLHSLLAVVLLLLCCQLWNVSSWHVQRHQKGSHLKTFCTSPRLVALTREKGENEKLKILLEKHSQIRCLELPCIEFRTCSAASLVKQLMPTTDLMIITSPQAASVIIPIWKSLGSPDVKVISLGVGTSKPLLAAGITPIFQPSQALASVLAQELPTHFGNSFASISHLNAFLDNLHKWYRP